MNRNKGIPPVSQQNRQNPNQPKNSKQPQKFQSQHYEQEMVDRIESEIVEHNTRVSWNDIADLDEAKNIIKEAAILPMIKPNYFKGIRRPWKGILLTGPPGTGKSLLAKALATECNATFFSVSSATLASKWRGDSEKLVKILFEMANFYAPSIIFIDEVDSLCSRRGNDDNDCSRRIKSEILVQMDGFGNTESGKQVMVLAATNFPWDLDEAFRRRLEKRVYIPLPTFKGRRQMLDINLKGVELDYDVDLDLIAHKLDGYSGADITNVCRDAAMMNMRDLIKDRNINQIKKMDKDLLKKPITMDNLLDAIKNTNSSVCSEDIEKIRDWIDKFGST